jgi:hypothetical protein
MHPSFRSRIETLDPKVDQLLAMRGCTYAELPIGMPASGIYLFTETGRHLYVGRSRRIRRRLSNHCRPNATHYQASLAFLLAREATGRTEATYTAQGSRADLCADPVFLQAFNAAKARLRNCEVRFVQEEEPVTQALLEIYAALRLATPYNDFDTH